MRRTRQNDRSQKEQALTRLFQGDTSAVEALRPELTLDLDQFTGDELERLSELQHLTDEEKTLWDLPRLETFFGRPLQLVPLSTYLTLWL